MLESFIRIAGDFQYYKRIIIKKVYERYKIDKLS